MDPSIGRVSEYIGRTNIHPFILLATIILVAVVFLAKKGSVIIPLLIAQSFITSAQRVSLAGLDFTVMRLLICAAIIRIILRREYPYFIPILLDKILFVYGAVSVIAYTLQVPGFSSIAYSIGAVIDNIGGYLVVRILVRDGKDFKTLVKTLMVIGIILVFFFLYESTKAVNLLNVFGGVRDTPIIRDGRLRAQGAYPHPILAGSFWAAVIPLFLGFCNDHGKRNFAMRLGVLAGTLIIIFCASSTPIMSLAFGIAATILFYQRASLVDLKLLLIAGGFGFMIFWNKPIWFLFTKIDLAGGSTGYFRYVLIDRFFQNWKDWVAFGVRSTYHWGEGLGLASVGLADLPNQYVLEGVRGGSVGLSLFIASIVIAFVYVGKILRAATNEDDRAHSWQLGVSMLVHMFSFLGVSYFGQIKFSWWMTIAIAGCLFQEHLMRHGNAETPHAAMSPDA